MRIAVNARFLLKDKLEGIGWFTYEVGRRLVQQHPEHEFIFLFDRPYDASFIFGENVTPIVLFPPARHPLLWLWWFEIAMPVALKRYKADVLLSPDGFCSLRAKAPTVMVIHDIAHVHMRTQIPAKFRVYYDFFVSRFLQRAERIVTVSQYSKKDIIQHFAISLEKIAVACNGVREVFKPLNKAQRRETRAQYADGEEYFLYVGAVHPRKNVHRVIEGFDAFKKQNKAPIKLLIGGRFAWQIGDVRDAFDAARFQNDIIFLDYVPDEALPKLMASALALVYVSLFEGFGVPLLEAMHCNIPVITSNVSSMPEVVGDAALLVNPLDVFEIARAMQDLYDNPDLREELIEKGKKQREQFSWDKAAEVVWENMLLAHEGNS